MSLSFDKNDYMTLVGTVLVLIGAYMPMVDLAGLASVTYADAADPEIYLLLLFAVAASVLIILDKRGLSMFAGIGAWLVMLWPVIKNIGGDDGGLLGKVTDPLSKVTQDLFMNVTDFEIGGFLFLGGMVLVLVGGIMNFLASR